jgi:hypothetical protein
MTDSKYFRTEVRSDHEFVDLPAVVECAIDAATAAEFVQLAGLVKSHGLYKVEKLDWRASYLKFDPDLDPQAYAAAGEDNELRTEADVLNVSDTSFWYSACLKHSDIEVRSEHQSLKDLAKDFGLDTIPDNAISG